MRARGGALVKPRGEGDSLFMPCLTRANGCREWPLIAFHNALLAEPWDLPEVGLRVRMALHTGEADLRDQRLLRRGPQPLRPHPGRGARRAGTRVADHKPT